MYLYERFNCLVSSICKAHLNQIEDAEDAAQEVWMKVIGTNSPPRTNEPGWLSRISQHECHDIFLKILRDTAAIEERRQMAAEETGGQGDRQLDDAIDLKNAMESLMPDERNIIRFHILEGLPFTEIAPMIGTSAKKISRIYHVAIAKLRRRLMNS